jgi:uncharacterized protein YbjT (DUF2867 family)
MRSSNILLTGASGRLGKELEGDLVKRGYHVRGASRRTSPRFDLGLPIPSELFNGIEIVIHAAYDFSSGEKFLKANVNLEGAESLVSTGIASGVKHFILISSDSANGNARSSYAKNKYEIKQIFLKSKMATVLRIGLIGGDNPIGPFAALCTNAAKRPFILLPRANAKIYSLTNISEICEAVNEVLIGVPLGGPFTISKNAESVSLRDSIEQMIKRNVRSISIAARILFRFIKFLKMTNMNLKVRSDSIKSIFITRKVVKTIWEELHDKKSF